MHCVVTGAAGFIGSHLCEGLLADGHTVTGIDCFTDYYPRPIKERNVANLRGRQHFVFRELDLSHGVSTEVVAGAEWVFHLAAMAGLTRSWIDFDTYARHNLTATHRLLEALKGLPSLDRLIYASTSSVYGRYASGDETLPTRPSSPYGITKLASEQLCRVYNDEFDVPSVVLRFFSVYGPRQRPEMGYHLFIDAMLKGKPIKLTGDGMQVRGNTFVTDCVDATIQATQAMPGETFNLGGGELVTVMDVLRKLERITGRPALIERHPPRKGDQLATGADIAKLTRHIGWKPTTGIDEGLERQVEWQKSLMASVTRRAA